MAFHHALPIVYLVSELASTLTVLRRQSSDTLIAEAIHSTLPPGVTARSLGGAIALDPQHGRLYVSNRGHDTIATFAVDAEGGVERIGCCATGGQSPRFILVDGDQLLVAHEEGGGVIRLPLGEDRLPRPREARAAIPGAAFLSVTR
jgi:6-phosphogluconolactonase